MSKPNPPVTIQVINPNSTCSVTKGIELGLKSLNNLLNAKVTCTQIDAAPPAIETSEHIRLIEPLIAEEISQSQADAHVIACFSDPAVSNLRESGTANIFGIAECAMLTAAAQKGNFGIISILPESIPRHLTQVRSIGLETRLAGDLALNLGVLALSNQEVTKSRLLKIGTNLRDKLNAQSLILGCAGMAGYRDWLQDKLQVPVIDPSRAAVSIAIASIATLSP